MEVEERQGEKKKEDWRPLYKYYKNFEYALDAVANRRIYFPTVDKLNDPFDCRPKFSLLSCKNESEEDWRAYFFILAKKGSEENITDEEADLHADGAIKKQKHKDLCWLYKADQSVKNNHKSFLEDNHLRICSFSQSSRNQMLWAHYADNHKGVVLQFRKSILKGKAFAVEYYDGRITLKRYVDAINRTWKDDDDVLAHGRLVFGSKSDEWKGEDEIRCFNQNKYLKFEEEMLAGILVGNECLPHRLEIFQKAISAWNRKPKIFKEDSQSSSLIKMNFRRWPDQ